MRKKEEGFSFIILIIAIVIVTLLVLTGLALANSNYSMKISDENRLNAVYSAESAMNEIRAGFENDVAFAIDESYKAVMASAATIPTDSLDKEFKYVVISDLDIRFTNAQHVGGTIIPSEGAFGTWQDNSHIYNYLIHKDGVEIVRYPDFEADYDNYTFTLKGISVKYTDPNGVYSGQVTTDIKFIAPDVFYVESPKDYDLDMYETYSIVADKYLGIEYAVVDGNVYAGENGIDICKDGAAVPSGKSSSVNILSDNVTTRGNVIINKQGTISFENTTLYANDIQTVNSGALSKPVSDYTALDFNGSAYLNGDTLLNLPYANVVMKGKYYGFNNSNGSDSSSFVVNASNVNADLTALSELFIGGTSYIEIPTTVTAEDVLTGESLTGKFTQSIYLVPSVCISVVRDGARVKVSNPIKRTELDSLQVDLSQNKEYGGIDLTKYADMTASKPYYTICTSYVNGQSIDNDRVYIYIKFASAEKAAEYAQNYAMSDPVYIHNRADAFDYGAITLNQNSIITTRGNMILNDPVDGVIIRKKTSTSAFESISNWQNSQATKTYKSLCSSLGSTTTDVMNGSLFDYVVETSLLNGGATSVTDGTLVCDTGLFYDNNIVSKYSGDVFTVLVASGDVAIQRDFKGLIIAGGSITCNANVNVEGLLLAGDSVNIRAGSYSNMTENEEIPLEYILEVYDNRNDVRKYFKQINDDITITTDISTLDIQSTIIYERWNTR